MFDVNLPMSNEKFSDYCEDLWDTFAISPWCSLYEKKVIFLRKLFGKENLFLKCGNVKITLSYSIMQDIFQQFPSWYLFLETLDVVVQHYVPYMMQRNRVLQAIVCTGVYSILHIIVPLDYFWRPKSLFFIAILSLSKLKTTRQISWLKTRTQFVPIVRNFKKSVKPSTFYLNKTPVMIPITGETD